jgi:hypothetical protein
MIGTAQAGVTANAAYDVFKRYYPENRLTLTTSWRLIGCETSGLWDARQLVTGRDGTRGDS